MKLPATCASDLAKNPILDATLLLKNAWGAVDPSTIEKCFVKCGFVDTALEMTNDEVALTSVMDTFVADSGVSWQDYANCDNDVSTCEALDENWQANLLSFLTEEESLPALEEGDDELQRSQVMEVKTAAVYLSGLRDFAVSHAKLDLLTLISKSQSIVEEMMW